MLNAVILDDAQDSAQAVERLIESSPFASRVSVSIASSMAQLMELLEDGARVDVLFADIVLGEGDPNGIEAVKSALAADSRMQVIYITGYAQYCVSVYETDHAYFLLKPVSQEDFDKALEKAISNIENRKREVLSIASSGQTILLEAQDVTHIESKLRKVIVHDGDEAHEAYSTLSAMLDRLPGSFIQCHKSFIVNMDAIKRFGSDELTLRNGATVPIGQRYKAAVKVKLAEHLSI